MTSTTPVTRTAIFHARPGHGGPRAERLLHAASLVAEAPGCELWLVHRDGEDPDTVRVSEMWASHTQCVAALDAPGVGENAAQVMELVDRPPDVVDGASTHRTCRRTPACRYELAEVGEARYVREHLGAVQVGLTHSRLRPLEAVPQRV
jgi:quinol monooxygenase YgiN